MCTLRLVPVPVGDLTDETRWNFQSGKRKWNKITMFPEKNIFFLSFFLLCDIWWSVKHQAPLVLVICVPPLWEKRLDISKPARLLPEEKSLFVNPGLPLRAKWRLLKWAPSNFCGYYFFTNFQLLSHSYRNTAVTQWSQRATCPQDVGSQTRLYVLCVKHNYTFTWGQWIIYKGSWDYSLLALFWSLKWGQKPEGHLPSVTGYLYTIKLEWNQNNLKYHMVFTHSF